MLIQYGLTCFSFTKYILSKLYMIVYVSWCLTPYRFIITTVLHVILRYTFMLIPSITSYVLNNLLVVAAACISISVVTVHIISIILCYSSRHFTPMNGIVLLMCCQHINSIGR